MSGPVRLEYLIEGVEGASHDPLQRLAVAVEVSGDVEVSARGLVQLFVEQARSSGISWTQIRLTMGISKQAAQKRFSSEAGRQPQD